MDTPETRLLSGSAIMLIEAIRCMIDAHPRRDEVLRDIAQAYDQLTEQFGENPGRPDLLFEGIRITRDNLLRRTS